MSHIMKPLFSGLFLLVAISLPVHALDLIPDFNLFGDSEEEGTYVWQGGQQYVKLVKREAGASEANMHPIQVSVEHLRVVLSNLYFIEKGGIFNDDETRIPVFVKSEISVLGSALARGLERATADEDIIFVVIAKHAATFGKERAVITGRVFYKDNELNIIFGEIHDPMNATKKAKAAAMAAGCGDCSSNVEKIEVFTIGSRKKEYDVDNAFARTAGLSMKHVDGEIRGDWLVLDINKMIVALEKEKNKLPPALLKEQQRTRLEQQRTKHERRLMREEMARLKKQMEQQGGGNGVTVKSLEERLQTLDTLKEKGLITDTEYSSRRKEILSDI